MKYAKSIQALRNGVSARLLAVAIAGLAAAQWPTVASAALVISSGTTKHMHCTAGRCTATQDTAVLNVSDLESMLAAGDIKVSTGAGSFAKTNDISVKAELAWGTASRLTLYAFRSIVVSQPIDVQGTGGGLTLTTNDGVSGSTMLSFLSTGHVTFTDYVTGRLFIDGKKYTLVNDIDSLAAEVANNAVGYYALASSRDAMIDHGGSYDASPIPGPSSGIFEGLGNTISNLEIDDPTDGERVGLFGHKSGGWLRDIRLASASITGSGLNSIVGALVATDDGGTIAGAHVTGSVVGGSNSKIGALAGSSNSIISYSDSTASVTAAYGNIGGLVGSNNAPSAAIQNSHASGLVTAAGPAGGSAIGGLSGAYQGTVTGSWSSGGVRAYSATSQAGGLVGGGAASTLIENSYATGSVTANSGDTNSHSGVLAGGLVGGQYDGSISASFETGNVFAVSNAQAGGQAATVYAGGLLAFYGAGFPENVIRYAYATGNVTGRAKAPDATAKAGGLIGDLEGSTTVDQAYSTGTPSVGSVNDYVGGSIADRSDNTAVTSVYWDTDTSGTDVGVGNNGSSDGVVGLSTTQFQSGLPAGFDPSVWTEDGTTNGGYPYLINNPPQ